jgi:hypothetical protein
MWLDALWRLTYIRNSSQLFHYYGPLKRVWKTKVRDQLVYQQVCNSSTGYQKNPTKVHLRGTNCDGQNREMKGRRGVQKNRYSRSCSLLKQKTHFQLYNKLPTTSRTSAVDIFTSLFFLRYISILYSHLICISQFYVCCKRFKIISLKIFNLYTTYYLITTVNTIFVTRTLIWVLYVFLHTEFKYVIRISLSATVFVTQKVLKCNFGEFSFFYAASLF